ncbi:MAG: precorrin-6y C5,15-methyltransferase (decarboxylating) subunit CbiE [Nodosilinea sp.]
MTPIQVVGVGLDGKAGLSERTLALVEGAAVLLGNGRHLGYFPNVRGEIWPLEDLKVGLGRLRQWLDRGQPGIAVVLASGDPLFFGLGRLLLAQLPPESLTFHPHVSAIQLAFSRLKLPWQTATLVSAHGRSTEELAAALRRGDPLIAVLTDPTHTPARLGQLLLDLDLPQPYGLWVCENLGGAAEAIHSLSAKAAITRAFADLNVVVLQRQALAPEMAPSLPILGLPDAAFATFADRPGLITKREIRLQVLGDLALQPDNVVWDIGAGTGSVSVEINRLCPQAQIYAVEKTLAGVTLIEQNRQNLGNQNLYPIYGTAPEVLTELPAPDRVFIGGSGGELAAILEACAQRLQPQGRLVLALATLEHISAVLDWIDPQAKPGRAWQAQLRQIQVQQAVRVGPLTRWQPLTPITIITLTPP